MGIRYALAVSVVRAYALHVEPRVIPEAEQLHILSIANIRRSDSFFVSALVEDVYENVSHAEISLAVYFGGVQVGYIRGTAKAKL